MGPLVEFEVETAGERWIVAYNLADHHLSSRPKAGWPGMSSVRQYLLHLHLAHSFPYGANARTVWAVVVDAMALVMVLWALTGILMWWQMRVVRLSGAIVLAISLLWACGLGYAMYEVFRH